ncbi:hypothetical protein H6F42_04725 [Pseudanabaena sp. FACHB-1998]|uniref:hypothetical protein n=1 Tax=Pseudanabaena sp. FACHB-1998 TaxID=2692858 RepID=UPI0016811DC7|nr:hypothetical protein [Pseudanabaena sp. FACHB-1998]MBD2176222.1 hypothetical protein [Pseudanabaena sp. FACHB-1998]
MNKLNKIYDLILEGLYSSYGITSELGRKEFLSGLKPHIRDLRESFQNKQVRVDYSNKNIQAAYLIAYYPSYVEMTYEVLNRHGVEALSFKNKELNVCLFGAGAAPEAIALLNFITTHNLNNIEVVVIRAYDIFASTWSFSLDLIEQFIVPHFWESKKFKLIGRDLDLCKHDGFKDIRQEIRNSNLLIFQNCLNELDDRNTAIQNIKYLAQNISPESTLIIADLSGYQVVIEAKSKIEYILKEIPRLNFFKSNDKEEIRIKTLIPLIIKQNLLTGSDGLIPRSTVKFNFISAYHLPEAPDVIPDTISLEILRAYIENLEITQRNTQQENEELRNLLNHLQQQTQDLQRRLDEQVRSSINFEDKENRDLSLERLDKSVAAVDISLRELILQNRDAVLSQTKLAHRKLEKRLWIAIIGAGGLGIIAICLLLISLFRR